jgi:general stress protein CsbA
MESYEGYLEEQESGGRVSNIFKNFFSKLEFIHYVGIAALIIVVNNLSKKGGNNKFVFIAIGIVLLIWILSSNKTQDKKPIPRHIAEQISSNDLSRLVAINSTYPTGTKAHHTGVFKVHHMDSGDPRGWGLDKYNFGFRISRPGKSDLHIIYQMNPYPPGNCQGIMEVPIIWTGEDVLDWKIIIPERTIIEEKKGDIK